MKKEDFKFDINKITPLALVFSLFTFAAIVSPGYIYFYVYHFNFFQTCDWVKLLILSIGITAPFFICNILVYNLFKSKGKDELIETTTLDVLIGASYITILVFYVLFIICYIEYLYFHCKLIPGSFISQLIMTQFFIVIVALTKWIYIKSKNK